MIGHIKVDRKILNWEWYKDIKMFHLFLYLLLKANFKDGKWQGISIKRGEVITGRIKVSADTGLSEREIRTCLNKLKKTGEITIKVTNKYSIVTICKYDTYQNQSKEIDQQKDQQEVSQETNKRPTKDQQETTIEECLINTNNDKFFNSMPKIENFNGLPEIKIGAAKELIRITSQVDLSDNDIKDIWEVFKIQNLTGKKYYQDKDAVYSHFINWVKKQDFKNGTKSVGAKKTGTSSDRIEALKKW